VQLLLLRLLQLLLHARLRHSYVPGKHRTDIHPSSVWYGHVRVSTV